MKCVVCAVKSSGNLAPTGRPFTDMFAKSRRLSALVWFAADQDGWQPAARLPILLLRESTALGFSQSLPAE